MRIDLPHSGLLPDFLIKKPLETIQNADGEIHHIQKFYRCEAGKQSEFEFRIADRPSPHLSLAETQNLIARLIRKKMIEFPTKSIRPLRDRLRDLMGEVVAHMNALSMQKNRSTSRK